jgi:DNA (cytosine-5)-methyltransferase 1
MRPMCRPRLLDLFAGAGGSAVGYHRAGFEVVGVDHVPQPRYPFRLVVTDALEYLRGRGREFDVVHASPPCQRYSVGARRWPHRGRHHPDLVGAIRAALEACGRPWVIENVVGAPLRRPVLLCGTMFGLRIYRHRCFEASFVLFAPDHRRHRETTGSHRGYSSGHPFVCVAGHNFRLAEASAAMGIDWMRTRAELANALPPAYTHFLGRQLLRLCD